VAAFGGSWTFIGVAVAAIGMWMGVNAALGHPFDPYILLNLALSCLAALQAPIIMMSQNRQATPRSAGRGARLRGQHERRA
jgi:uncharacterized membrane protein